VFLLTLASVTSFAQEVEPVVVDEVVAQVNNDVITLSMLKRETKDAAESLQQARNMSPQQALDEVTRRRPELIANLINEELLIQKGKDLGYTNDVEAEVNRRMLDVAKEQGIKTIEGLDDALRQSGLDPAGIRQKLRSEIMKGMVLSREVDAKIFFSLTNDELKKYFNAHQDKFMRPESVTLSEIYLSLAGKSEAEVRAKALQLIQQARSGADFGALAAANSEREENGVRTATTTKGKVGAFQVPNLRADIAAAIKNVPAGGISEPLRTDEGFQILRVDERTPGSSTAIFNEDQVRQAITAERSEKEHEAYLQNLRNDAYIQIAENYRAAVEPLLKLNTKTTASAANKAAPPVGKSNDKKSKKQ
jgi:peptidyl-prolyl cis-trans isomerase SurA